MRPEDENWPWRAQWLDIAWVAFALLNLSVMVAYPTLETIPFHFIWVSLTLLYGFRVWSLGRTSTILAFVIVLTGASILADAASGTEPVGESAEVPLMAAMFVAMVWHARRRMVALDQVQHVSESNARLLEREKQFLQDASHELRTPITVALGHAELILRATQDPAIAEDARVVIDELGRLRTLADRLLLIAAAEQPTFLQRRRIAPASIVEEALRRWGPIPRAWSLREEAAPPILADRDRLSTALDALIENAVEHTEEGAAIHVGVRVDGASVVLSVSDAGTGIQPDQLDRILGRFSRVDAGRDRSQGGVGLGLSIANAIAEAHGGRLRARSTPGAGSLFEIVLPAAASAELPAGGPIPLPATSEAVSPG